MKNYQEVNFTTKVGFACGAIALAFVLATGGCGDDPQPVKNRVPTVGIQLEQAQQAAKEAQAAADRAEQTRKDIQASIDKLNGSGRNSDGSWKIGQAQVTSVGTVTEVGEIKQHEGESTTTFTFWFTFAERAGFVRKFSPVCPNQVIPVNNAVTLNFHWREYQDQNNVGCYQIDGYTVVK